MEGNNEVVDRFGLGGDLTEGDSDTLKRSPNSVRTDHRIKPVQPKGKQTC